MRRLGHRHGIWCGAAAIAWILLASGVASASSGFGVSKFTIQTTQVKEVMVEAKDGSLHPEFEYVPYAFTQAGGHPDAVTATLEFHNEGPPTDKVPVGGDVKDVSVDLPQGLLGNPTVVPRCELAAFTHNGDCPPASQVGVVEFEYNQVSADVDPIYNLVPETGQSAEFGIPTGGRFNVLLTAHVARLEKTYRLTVVSNGIPQRGFTRFKTSFWGVPADSSHDPERGRRCGTDQVYAIPPTCNAGGLDKEGGASAGIAPLPFLTFPADCAADRENATVEVDSWQEPGHYLPGPEAALPVPTSCNALAFDPSITVAPETAMPDSPVGLEVGLHVPQTEAPGVPATPEVRDATVTLPAGMSINPGVVDGVQACDETGPSGLNIDGAESEVLGPAGEPQLAPGKCPNSSIVGTAEAVTPLLPEPVKGHVFLARPLCGGEGPNACTDADTQNGRLYRLYLELGGTGVFANAGVNIKAAGVVSVNPTTGQISSSFTENPQLPFSELKINLKGGPQAPVANPTACGPAQTTANLVSWSAPGRTSEGALIEGIPDADPFTFYDVTGCSGSRGLAPGFLAGTSASVAGEFAPFTLSLTRKDGEQDFAGLQVHTPPGLLGMLSSVPLCGEPEAGDGHCPESSRIGSTLVASGAGAHPFEIGGNVYLTNAYGGAPFGLSIVTHAVAGPFDLGLVVVRARIDVDPHTSTLTVTSDPLPQIVFGVPLRLQRLLVKIDRPGFMFNPTNCDAMRLNAAVSGAEGAKANVSSPFAVGGCRGMAFKPTFKVSVSGRTSRSRGASLDAKVSFPSAVPGSQANVARVKVSLPKQLPSRLATLQKACPAATFEHDPGACPSASIVGVARTTTPVLPVELSGPVYFVSHGGDAFPSLIVVLQGDGVRVDLVGTTFISKAGITSSTFQSVPDVPVRTFELYLPQGRDSALAANSDLCANSQIKTVTRRVTVRVNGRMRQRIVKRRVRTTISLIMPTEFTGQNGAVFRQRTKIAVTGCPAVAASIAKRRGGASK